MIFKDFWNIMSGNLFRKSSDKLTKAELVEIQDTIHSMQKKGSNANKIIKYLQDHNHKLAERYKAERAFFTELKRLDTEAVKDSASELDMEKFQVILSPHACPVCVKKTSNGNKVFTKADLQKSGYGHYPPFHPNCYCILVPRE